MLALRANIRQQSAVREQVRYQRRQRGLAVPLSDPDRIPILVSDEGPYVHHSATAEDVREVLRRLPPGMLDGLNAVHLCLCREQDNGTQGGIDPYTGSPATELLPSIYQGCIRGDCSRGGGEVRVFAHIHPPGAAGVQAIYLKMRSLATLVHECSHHFDDSFRGERERWHKWDEARNETYVRARALNLVETCVVPFLEERCAEECRALSAWMELHGGIAIPLARLTDDRNASRLGADNAYLALVHAVAAGKAPIETRREFASSLSEGGCHREAAMVLERVHAKRPDHLETVLALACARLDAGQVEEAEMLGEHLLELAPEDARTWMMLTWLRRRRARWAEQASCAERLLALHAKGGHGWTLALDYRADASMGLERWDDVAADIAALEAVGSPLSRERARVLTLRMQCQTGRWKEALAGATRALRDRGVHFWNRPFVKAVRFDCAQRLGRRSVAGKLTERDIEILRSYGQGAWVDRLAAELGLRPEKKLRFGSA